MVAPVQNEKLYEFYREICLDFVGSLRALSLYAQGHPESKKKIDSFFQRVSRYLEKRTSLTLLFVSGEVIVENTALPELRGRVEKFIQRLEEMKFQRLVFRKGLTKEELSIFLQLLLPLLKSPAGADLVIAKNQGRLPHILAGSLLFDPGSQVSYEEFSSALNTVHQSITTFSGQLKDLFSELNGPLSESKVLQANKTAESMYDMVKAGELPLKILIYRRSTDPDPFIHAINVCALSISLSKEIGLEDSVIKEIGLAALLHDIGLHISPSMSLKETSAISLDEKKLQWEHPVRGAKALLVSPGLPDIVPMVAYEHHIHYDGGGYPVKSVTRQPNLASMIVFIANTYDNLRRNRAEGAAMNLTDTLNWMDRRIGTHFHPLLFKKFRALAKAQVQEEI